MQKLSKPKIIFMGTPDFAANILKAMLENNFNIISVYTREDKKNRHKKKPEKAAVKKIAQKNNLKVFEPKKFDENTILEIKNQKPDLIIVSAYGKILSQEILDIPRLGVINTHPSLLPKYRGASPIQNAILNGEKETAVTIMKMEKEVDAGDILVQEKIKIGSEETYLDLSKKLSKISAKLLLKIIPLWMTGKIEPKKQDDSKASFCQMIKKEDGKIKWKDNAQNIYNRYRAFISWPGVFTYWSRDGRDFRVKLNIISFEENKIENNFKIGEIFLKNEKVKVKTSKGNIILEEIQLEGKNKIKINDFIRGYPAFIESVLR